MHIVLVIVTGVSVALAATLAVLFARAAREERRRSDARVALLTRLAYGADASEETTPARMVSATAAPHAVGPSAAATNPFDDVELRASDGDAPAHIRELFQPREVPTAWPGRFGVAIALSVFAGAAVIGWNITPPRRATAPVPARDAAAAGPLELVSLRHTLAGGTFTVSGVVQNPAGGSTLERVEAHVLMLDAEGGVLSAARAPLDFTTLPAGEESSFVIRIPVEGAVARYRVGFRGADGRVIGHVDRRNSASLAGMYAP